MLLTHHECACPYRRQGHSRVVACLQLKREIDAARAIAVATGVTSADKLPHSCRQLKPPAQLPVLDDQWSITFTDIPFRHHRTGLVM